MNPQYVIVCDSGDEYGPEYVGPFPSHTEAEKYAAEWIGCPTTIAEVDPPAMETTGSIRRKVAAGEWN